MAVLFLVLGVLIMCFGVYSYGKAKGYEEGYQDSHAGIAPAINIKIRKDEPKN